jgi:hypothetical protein
MKTARSASQKHLEGSKIKIMRPQNFKFRENEYRRSKWWYWEVLLFTGPRLLARPPSPPPGFAPRCLFQVVFLDFATKRDLHDIYT